MNYLIIAAHPDDEVLGAGGTIAKLSSTGNNVALAIMVGQAGARANLSDTLDSDMQKAMEILGICKLYKADFPNIKMNTVPHLEQVQFLESCIMDFKPEAIITHHPADVNIDHVETSKAAQAACRLHLRRPGLPAIKRFLYMEVASSTEWSLAPAPERFTPNYYTEIGSKGLEKKLQAMNAYKGVMRPYPHPRSVEAITGLAAYRGSQAGCDMAEAFECMLYLD